MHLYELKLSKTEKTQHITSKQYRPDVSMLIRRCFKLMRQPLQRLERLESKINKTRYTYSTHRRQIHCRYRRRRPQETILSAWSHNYPTSEIQCENVSLSSL